MYVHVWNPHYMDGSCSPNFSSKVHWYLYFSGHQWAACGRRILIKNDLPQSPIQLFKLLVCPHYMSILSQYIPIKWLGRAKPHVSSFYIFILLLSYPIVFNIQHDCQEQAAKPTKPKTGPHQDRWTKPQQAPWLAGKSGPVRRLQREKNPRFPKRCMASSKPCLPQGNRKDGWTMMKHDSSAWEHRWTIVVCRTWTATCTP